jgi:hypothetical protein
MFVDMPLDNRTVDLDAAIAAGFGHSGLRELHGGTKRPNISQQHDIL